MLLYLSLPPFHYSIRLPLYVFVALQNTLHACSPLYLPNSHRHPVCDLPLTPIKRHRAILNHCKIRKCGLGFKTLQRQGTTVPSRRVNLKNRIQLSQILQTARYPTGATNLRRSSSGTTARSWRAIACPGASTGGWTLRSVIASGARLLSTTRTCRCWRKRRRRWRQQVFHLPPGVCTCVCVCVCVWRYVVINSVGEIAAVIKRRYSQISNGSTLV